jgi:ribosomal protein S18 acetylase RimI-like enzyme
MTAPQIRPMSVADIPLGMRLKAAAGWNQTEADWRRFLALGPEGCFVAENEGGPVGTITTVCFGERVGYIGMVLVDPAQRRQGIGRALLLHGIEHLRGRGIRTIRLDATDAGRRVYDPLGFVAEYVVERRIRPGSGPAGPTPPEARLRPDPLTCVLPLDALACGVDRSALLQALLADQAAGAGDGADGYVIAREGSSARFIGPCVARSAESAEALLSTLLGALGPGPVMMDVPVPNARATAWAAEHGFSVQRAFTRMYLGEPPPREHLRMIFAASGPEKG